MLRHRERFDWIIVGAGFAGSVLAERLASQLNRKVLIIDRRDHIGGNAFDCTNNSGLLIHRYGPHIFHTNSDAVVAYLSKFTTWRPYEHRVLTSVNGSLYPFPINLDTLNRLYSITLDSEGMRLYLAKHAKELVRIRNAKEALVSRIGVELYELFFRNYTTKQWGTDPERLSPSVVNRIPVRFDRDDRYFSDRFQAMPAAGYTAMFERMLDHPLITIQTGVDYNDVRATYTDARVVFTGPIDEYHRFAFGALPYRSLEFRHVTIATTKFQPAAVINYPNDHDYTRVTEFKYLTGQRHESTAIAYEYPRAVGDPYYPVPCEESAAIYDNYAKLAARQNHVIFCGRLATYKYLNMDQVVAMALRTFDKRCKIY